MVIWRSIVIGLAIGSLLACGGLTFRIPAVDDVDREEALDAGFAVPPGAVHIHGSRFSDLDRSFAYVRFTLPADAMAPLVASYRANAAYTEHASWDVPSDWPDFGDHDVPPPWWQPTGSVVFRTSQPADLDGDGSDIGRGALVSVDVETYTVFRWEWEWQWWTPQDPASAGSGL